VDPRAGDPVADDRANGAYWDSRHRGVSVLYRSLFLLRRHCGDLNQASSLSCGVSRRTNICTAKN
jgi:hypothetical protein